MRKQAQTTQIRHEPGNFGENSGLSINIIIALFQFNHSKTKMMFTWGVSKVLHYLSSLWWLLATTFNSQTDRIGSSNYTRYFLYFIYINTKTTNDYS